MNRERLLQLIFDDIIEADVGVTMFGLRLRTWDSLRKVARTLGFHAPSGDDWSLNELRRYYAQLEARI